MKEINNYYCFDYYTFKQYLKDNNIDYLVFLDNCGFFDTIVVDQRLQYRKCIHLDIIGMIKKGLNRHNLDTSILYELCYNISDDEYYNLR